MSTIWPQTRTQNNKIHTVMYSIATCPHCPPGERQRRIKEEYIDVDFQAEMSKAKKIYYEKKETTTVKLRFECRKDKDGNDERIIDECTTHKAKEIAKELMEGKASRDEFFEKILAEERSRG